LRKGATGEVQGVRLIAQKRGSGPLESHYNT
jgi:hypothetical protein